MNYFVTAIGTDSGKTVISAILTETLKADYWKPIQAGMPRDTATVEALVTNGVSNFHREQYLLNTPASPHAAAKIDEVTIALDQFKIPDTDRDLVIEGAGGILVPLNDSDFVIDMVSLFQAQIILVANLYLGSINHTLLTIEALKQRKLSVKGLIFNGPPNPESESIILKHSGYRCLLKIPQEPIIDTTIIKKYAEALGNSWNHQLADQG